ncbi:MAG: steroid 5-alpha reductase family enzyme [Planctomycetota bacterium]|jgi:steroid 5-alpha reductase family enzyme
MRNYSPISLNLHAAADFIALLFLLASPWLLGFSNYPAATQYVIALFIIGMSLNIVTDYALGVFKKNPFKWHRMVELASPPIFIGVPWFFFSDAGLMPWVASFVGIGAVLNSLLTKPVTIFPLKAWAP